MTPAALVLPGGDDFFLSLGAEQVLDGAVNLSLALLLGQLSLLGIDSRDHVGLVLLQLVSVGVEVLPLGLLEGGDLLLDVLGEEGVGGGPRALLVRVEDACVLALLELAVEPLEPEGLLGPLGLAGVLVVEVVHALAPLATHLRVEVVRVLARLGLSDLFHRLRSVLIVGVRGVSQHRRRRRRGRWLLSLLVPGHRLWRGWRGRRSGLHRKVVGVHARTFGVIAIVVLLVLFLVVRASRPESVPLAVPSKLCLPGELLALPGLFKGREFFVMVAPALERGVPVS
mmetsp:Transcript_11411/g.19258  ORF Transcript_11411/g.19258 Transcript_11411/m.19258 type:complete len:284 (+) Transcript_11411:91-942(+)